jgi:hypothetical protein
MPTEPLEFQSFLNCKLGARLKILDREHPLWTEGLGSMFSTDGQLLPRDTPRKCPVAAPL